MINREKLEHEARNVMGYLIHVFGKRIGITLFVFEFGDRGNLAYISNATREDMVATVKEWLAREEAGLTTDPQGPRGAA